jgi:hemolysin activation/secretion protein
MRNRILLLFAFLLVSGPASAQVLKRPADERPPLESFELPAPREEPSLALPPPPPPPNPAHLSAGLRVFIREIRVVGSSVFSSEDLARVTAPWTGREIASGELQDVAEAVTSLYVRNGYVSSGAMIPDQDVTTGILTVEVTEATLSSVTIEGNRWYRDEVLRRRLLTSVSDPVNMQELEQGLKMLLADPEIRGIHGELLPGQQRGQNVLVIKVEEENPFVLSTEGGNDNPPGIGSWGGQINAGQRNLLGFGDSLRGWFAFTEGFDSQEIRYSLPFNAYGTSLLLHFRRSNGEIVEDPFDEVDIEIKSWTGGIGLQHPFLRTPSRELLAGIMGEWRRVDTSILGRRFSFEPGPDDGRADLSVLRFFQQWTSRSRTNVFVARSTVSWGIDVLDATTHSDDDIPDARFVAWLGQFQWAHLFSQRFLGTQLLVRADVQVANDPLLSLEQFAVGGLATVRGYRENQLVRDNGVVASVELRIPVLTDQLGPHSVEFVPFVDYGRSWNVDKTPSPKTIASIGLGLRYAFRSWFRTEAYWGGRLKSAPKRGNDLQNDGFHILSTFRLF